MNTHQRSHLALAPVGVYDSGVGGLSILREIRALLPSEQLLYVADTAHCPYGVKTQEQIRARAHAIATALLEQEAKAIVVACNAASGAALDSLRAAFDVPIIGIEPAIKPAVAASRSHVVGVLSTDATIRSERFGRLIERFAEGTEVLTQPCQDLVALVEAGELDGERTEAIVRGYVEPLLERGADTLLLGCTHYPFLSRVVAEIAGPEVAIIDNSPAVARHTAHVLEQHGMLAPLDAPPSQRFWTTGDPQTVQPVIARLWGAPVAVEHLDR